MNIKKQAISILVIIILVGVIQGLSYYFKKPGPEKLTLEFISNSTKIEKVQEIVSQEDAIIVKKIGLNYLELIKTQLPPGNTEVKITSSLAISDSQHKVDIAVSDKIISYTLIKEGSSWKIFFDLSKKHKISELVLEIKELETLNNEPAALLRAYQDLNELSPSEDYDQKIAKLKEFLSERDERELYKQQIEFSKINLKAGFLSGVIQNKGNRSVGKIVATLLFANPKGEIIGNQEVVIFEVIPDSFVFGTPIKSKFEKKFGLNLTGISLPKGSVLNLEVKSVEFYK